MSRIYFHAEADEAEVAGAERASMRLLCNRIFLAALHVYDLPSQPDPVRRLIPAGHYLHRASPGREFEWQFETWCSGSDNFVTRDGQVGVADVALNTALAVGNDALRLCARLHGQCEAFCWVDGPDREWLAGLIEQGLECGVLRRSLRYNGGEVSSLGWDKVIDLLRSSADGPVVCSYSVCEQFPNANVCRDAGTWDGTDDEWYDLPDGQCWERGVAALRRREEDQSWQLHPDNFAAFRYAGGLTAFTLREAAPNVA